jgi:hypothetical protein
LINDLMFMALTEGIVMDPVEQELNMPGMGEVIARMEVTVTGARFELRGDDGGRVRVTVLGTGDPEIVTKDFEGDVMTGPDPVVAPPKPPAPLPVSLTALAEPYFELRDDRTVSMGLDLRRSELVELGVDPDFGVPEDVDAEAWASVLQLASVMFVVMGDALFAGLIESVSSVGMDLGEDVGTVLADLGVDHGPADVQVSSGVLSFGLPARVETEGRAMPVPVAGKRFGVSVARSGVDRVTADLLQRVVGGVPLPFELELDLADQRISGRIRQPRLISEHYPDMRGAVRTEVGVRLVRGRLELGVSAAWLELPSFVPGFLNSFNRRLGGLLSFAPLRFRLPSTIELPIVPGSDERLPVRVDDLRISAEGVGVVLALA